MVPQLACGSGDNDAAAIEKVGALRKTQCEIEVLLDEDHAATLARPSRGFRGSD